MQGLTNTVLLVHVLTCLQQTVHGSLIIHGRKVPGDSMQYMVSVQNTGHHACGGFLISEDTVVTAAHCAEPTPDHVVLGAHNLESSNVRKIKIKSICKYPDYQSVGLGKDIMLLKLDEKVTLSNRVKTIPISNTKVKGNQACSVAGWGRTEYSSNSNVHELRVVSVSIINPETCKQQWPGLPQDVICAGGFGTNKGFCQGDSGGPLVCDGKAVGIVSFNRNANCIYPDVPNVYTEISRYFPWIYRNLQETECVS